MRFSIALTLAAAASTAVATPVELELAARAGLGGMTFQNNYGAPIPPWKSGSKPGWYYGNSPQLHPGLPCLNPGLICKFLFMWNLGWLCPSHPPPPKPTTTTSVKPTTTKTSATPTATPTVPADGYVQTFSSLTGATQGNDYLTFGLVDTVADCKAMCNSVSGCGFANTYHDVNGKDGSTQLTCALYKGCHTAADATNTGGQTQPNGSVDYITNSDGWCKH